MDPYLQARSTHIRTNDTSSDKAKALRDEMMRVREAQQKLVHEKSLETKAKEQVKKIQQMEQKRVKHPMEYSGGKAHRLGGDKTSDPLKVH